MMVSKKEEKASRIPIRFLDEEKASADGGAGGGGEEETDSARSSNEGQPTAEELGRESSYEGETEMQRRIDRGQEDEGGEGRERADKDDTAGGPPHDELPERREDQHQAAPPSKDSVNADGEENRLSQANASATAKDAEATGPVLAELIATRAELRRVETDRDTLRNALAQRQADFENYRKRMDRERGETYNRMVGDVVSKLLPVLDNLRRALDTEATLQANESEEFRHFLRGIELIYKQFSNVLEGFGLQPVAAVGHPFDPHVHDAVVTEQTEEYEPDTVIEEIVRGYRLGEKLLRPAVVKVATR
jgi:molecular chaperone GrpE